MAVMATAERPETDLDRLLELELTEIPHIRDALRDWADDAHLAAQLHRLEAEADVLRDSLAVKTREATAAARWDG